MLNEITVPTEFLYACCIPVLMPKPLSVLNDRKIRVAIFKYTGLNMGAGEEKAVLNYISHAPFDKFELTIYQTDYCPRQNLSNEIVLSYLKSAKLVTIKSVRARFRFDEIEAYTQSSLLRLVSEIFRLFLAVSLSSLYSRIVNRDLFHSLKETDIIYVYDSEQLGYIPYFARRKKIIACFRRDFGRGGSSSSYLALFFLKGLAFLIDSWMLRYVTCFHYLTKRNFSRSPIHRKNDFVLPSGTDTSLFFPKRDSRSGRLKFLFVGRLEKIKGIAIAVDAFEQMKSSDCELRLVGAGPMSNYAKAAAERSENISYLGYLSGEELATIYRSSDVLVLPTLLAEQHPLVVIEAIASGLAVLVSDTLKGIFDEFASLGYLEYIHPDKNSLTSKMSEYSARKAELRGRMNDISSSAKGYDWSIIAQRLFSKFVEV